MKNLTKKVLILGLVFNFANVAFAENCSSIHVQKGAKQGDHCYCMTVDNKNFNGKLGKVSPSDPCDSIGCTATCQ